MTNEELISAIRQATEVLKQNCTEKKFIVCTKENRGKVEEALRCLGMENEVTIVTDYPWINILEDEDDKA